MDHFLWVCCKFGKKFFFFRPVNTFKPNFISFLVFVGAAASFTAKIDLLKPSGNEKPIRTRENYYLLIWWILNPDIHSFKGILFPGSWTPESGKSFFMKAGILSFGIRNTAQWIQIPLTIGIRNPIFTDKIQYMCTLNPEPAAWESRIETVWIPLSIHHTYLNTMLLQFFNANGIWKGLG